MKTCRILNFRNLTAAAVLTLWSPTRADIIGSAHDNGDGTTTYSYIVNNTAGAFDLFEWSLDFSFPAPDWNQLDTVSGGDVQIPNIHWFADAGIPLTGLSAQDFLSLDSSGDVLAGTELSGFSFISSYAPGVVTYHEFSAAGSASGTTVGPVGAVPESGGNLEMIAFTGLICFGAFVGKSSRR